jgi:YD repeat-containing protein
MMKKLFSPTDDSKSTHAPADTAILPTARFNGIPFKFLDANSICNPSNGADGDDAASTGIGQVTGADSVGAGSQDTAGGMVFLHNGELIRRLSVLTIPGRGFDWKMDLTYRSGQEFNGPLGHNWDFSYNRRIVLESNGDIVRMDGYGRADRYVHTAQGLVSPVGFFTQLTRVDDTIYLERDRHGGKAYYFVEQGQNMGLLISLSDRNGNTMKFEYGSSRKLSTISDTLGRSMSYSYNALTGRLTAVQDFSGRTVTFHYDEKGDLIALTRPAVTGTPNNNDFPDGKTSRFGYSSGYQDARLNHQLLSVTAPNEVAAAGPPCIMAQYQTDTKSTDVGRLTQLTIGGTSAGGLGAGGTMLFSYERLTPTTIGINTPVFQNTVTDRNGNMAQYQVNQIGNIVQIRRFTHGLRKGEPTFYQTRYTYNADGLMITCVKPLGNIVAYTYDSGNADRFQQGNLRSVVRNPDAAR